MGTGQFVSYVWSHTGPTHIDLRAPQELETPPKTSTSHLASGYYGLWKTTFSC